VVMGLDFQISHRPRSAALNHLQSSGAAAVLRLGPSWLTIKQHSAGAISTEAYPAGYAGSDTRDNPTCIVLRWPFSMPSCSRRIRWVCLRQS